MKKDKITNAQKISVLNMKLKAKYKWNGEEVKVKPVYFSWHVGLQYKTLTGYSAASIFYNSQCCMAKRTVAAIICFQLQKMFLADGAMRSF